MIDKFSIILSRHCKFSVVEVQGEHHVLGSNDSSPRNFLSSAPQLAQRESV